MDLISMIAQLLLGVGCLVGGAEVFQAARSAEYYGGRLRVLGVLLYLFGAAFFIHIAEMIAS